MNTHTRQLSVLVFHEMEPAAALSVMLGSSSSSISSAVRWARCANRDWTAFVQTRDQQG